jgi:hypothetical protein
MSFRSRGIPALAWWKIACVIVVCFLLVALSLSGADAARSHQHYFVGEILDSLAAIVLTAGVVSIFIDQLIRRELSSFWLEVIGVKQSIADVGLLEAVLDNSRFDFKTYLEEANEVDICIMYARTWVNSHIGSLRTLLSRDNTVLRVCIMDSHGPFAAPFSISLNRDLVVEIQRCEEAFTSCAEDLRRSNKLRGQLVICRHKAPPRHTYFRFDDIVIYGAYPNAPRKGPSPLFTFARRKNGIAEFLEDDFDNLIKDHSTTCYDSKKQGAALSGF